MLNSRRAISGPCIIWIDVLCIPPQHLRLDGISSIAMSIIDQVVPRASALLVVDTDIAALDDKSSYPEIYLKITFSSWGSRLWTLYESLLARRLYFAFNKSAVSLEELDATCDRSSNGSTKAFVPRLLYAELRAAAQQENLATSTELLHRALSGRRTSNTQDTFMLQKRLEKQFNMN